MDEKWSGQILPPYYLFHCDFKLKRHRVILFLKVDVVKDRIDILIDLWFGIPSFFNTFPSAYQAKYNEILLCSSICPCVKLSWQIAVTPI